MKQKHKRPDFQKDPRITAPLVSLEEVLLAFGILYLLTFLSVFLFDEYLNKIGSLVVVLGLYLAVLGILIAVLIGILWRNTIGKSIRKVAIAAKRVASGDFSVQIPVDKKHRRKNEIDVLIGDFNTMVRELADNEMLKNDFISNVSHEMKTPLSVILSYTKALKDGRVPAEERDDYMQIVITSAEKLNETITNILKLSKLENQQIFPEAKPYQLGEQLRHCALGYMEKWQEKDITFDIDVVDVSVNYDASLLETVWNNLLSNAVKFTDNGGTIWLKSRLTDYGVSVSVSDTGCGMSQDTLNKVYEKFYQGDTSHSSEGNGLGLALAKRIVDICGGKITAESQEGKGTTFTVELKI